MPRFSCLRCFGAASLAAALVALAACGGGDGTSPPSDVGPAAVAPTVTSQPADASVTAPSAATFSAATSGTPAPSVQWQRSNDGGITWVAITGATAASYTTPVTVAGDNDARFRAVFTNAAGSTTTNAGRLTVTMGLAPGLSLLAGSLGGGGTLDGTGSGARFDDPVGMAHDASGNLYVADWHQHTIRKITPAGVVTTFAGRNSVAGAVDGIGGAATFSSPYGLAIDRSGNLVVADSGNSTLRKVTPQGAVTTLAGTPGAMGSADGTGAAARFGFPTGVTTDAAGNAYVADLDLVRKVTPAGAVTTAVGVDTELGVRLGTDARLNRVSADAWLPTGQLAITSEAAVLPFTLP